MESTVGGAFFFWEGVEWWGGAGGLFDLMTRKRAKEVSQSGKARGEQKKSF